MKTVFAIVFILASQTSRAEMFYKFVPSAELRPECATEPEDERGPFGIDYKDRVKEHVFLVMTGVYYDTCVALEKRINYLRKKHKHLLLIGTEGYIDSPSKRVWRWRSLRSVDGSECVSYFDQDCPVGTFKPLF